MNIRFLSFADGEVDDAVSWYEEQWEGLSRIFLDELDRVVRLGMRTATVPKHREVAAGTLRSILRQAGMRAEDFEKL